MREKTSFALLYSNTVEDSRLIDWVLEGFWLLGFPDLGFHIWQTVELVRSNIRKHRFSYVLLLVMTVDYCG